MDAFAIVYIIFAIIACCYFVFRYVERYAHRTTNIVCKVTIQVSWFFSAMLVWLVPLDLKVDHKNALFPFYQAVYWIAFSFTWLVIPIQQSYWMSGYFTIRTKMKGAIRENALFYMIVGFIFVVLIIYLAASTDLTLKEVPALLMGMGNLWGLSACVLLLGYGLIELPRYFWFLMDDEKNLDLLYYKIANYHEENMLNEERLRDSIAMVKSVNTNLTFELNYIMNKLSREQLEYKPRRRPEVHDEALKELVENDPDVYALSLLHYRIKWDLIEYEVTNKAYERILQKVDDTLNSQKHNADDSNHRMQVLVSKALSVVFGIGTIFILWGELTLLFNRDLSLFASVTSHSGKNSGIIIFGLLGFTYMMACVTYAMNQLHLLSYYHMHPHQGTNMSSFLFNAALVLRFVFPLGYNFLLLFDSDEQSSFKDLCGQMDHVPIFGDVNYYLPILIWIFCIATWFNVYEKLLGYLQVNRFSSFGRSSGASTRNADVSDSIRDGRRIVNRRRRESGKSSVDRFVNGRNGLLGSDENQSSGFNFSRVDQLHENL